MVLAGIAVELVDSRAALEDVVVASSAQDVVSLFSHEQIVPGTGVEVVVARPAAQLVGLAAAEEEVGAVAPQKPVAAYQALPQFPSVERDLALIVPEGVSSQTVSETMRRASGSELEALELFDVYTGAGIPDATRSIAFRLRFRSPRRTLKDKEVDKAVKTVLRRLEEELGVEARG